MDFTDQRMIDSEYVGTITLEGPAFFYKQHILMSELVFNSMQRLYFGLETKEDEKIAYDYTLLLDDVMELLVKQKMIPQTDPKWWDMDLKF